MISTPYTQAYQGNGTPNGIWNEPGETTPRCKCSAMLTSVVCHTYSVTGIGTCINIQTWVPARGVFLINTGVYYDMNRATTLILTAEESVQLHPTETYSGTMVNLVFPENQITFSRSSSCLTISIIFRARACRYYYKYYRLRWALVFPHRLIKWFTIRLGK